MGQILHGCAKTTEAVRINIKNSQESGFTETRSIDCGFSRYFLKKITQFFWQVFCIVDDVTPKRTTMKTVTAYTFLSFVLVLLVSGCKYTNTPERANEMMVSGWVGPTACPSAAQATYCYETLGGVDCYHEAQPGWEHRLVGSYEPSKASSKPQIKPKIFESKPPEAIAYAKPTKPYLKKKKLIKKRRKPRACPKGCIPSSRQKVSTGR
ncbi:MAG: hypothetical protein ACRCYZ_01875 [Alphaproteobacteria bacterium]